MYYGLIILASLMASFQFVFNNGYQKENGAGLRSALDFTLYGTLISLVPMIIICKFKVEFTWFAVAVAFVHALTTVVYNYAAVKALSNTNLSVYSLFAMLGGMALPFLYGTVFCNEGISVSKILCFVFIALSLFITVERNSGKKGAVKYYIAVFILNGMFGVLSKFHLMNVENCIDSSSFLMWSKIFTIVISAIMILFDIKNTKKLSKKSVAYCSGYAVISTVSGWLILLSLDHLPASVQYPMITGGVIAFTAVVGTFFGQKPSKKEITAAVIAFVATIMMMF
ncbi:MAG: hypothetical protein IJB86_11155 [Clostridia bacterium]|nr:hypothetical protein [Clostridia bacterium]